jgi:alpha-L-arabinofuranosidase
VSYYVQQLFAMNKGTNVLSLTMNGKPVAGQEGQDGLFASSVFDAATGQVVVKVVNTSDKIQPLSIQLQGMTGTRNAQIITLTHVGMDDENTLDNPEKIIPVEGSCQVDAGKKASLLLDDIPAKTFRIYKIKR